MPADEPIDPSLESLMLAFCKLSLDGVRVMLPGVVTSYDPATQKASVQPQVMHARVDEDTGERRADPLPEVHDAPVMFLGPARGRITWPVAVGDKCAVFYASSSISRWVTTGRLLDPGDDRHHDLSDAVVLVGLHDFAHVPTDAPTDAVVLHAGDGVTVKIGGSSGTEKTFKADTFLDALDTLVAAIASAVGSISGGTAAGTAITTAKGVFDTAVAAAKTDKTEVK